MAHFADTECGVYYNILRRIQSPSVLFRLFYNFIIMSTFYFAIRSAVTDT